MLTYPNSYCNIFKSSASAKVREGPVKITVEVTWHCSFLASVKILEGSTKIAFKVKVFVVTFSDCYWGSMVAFQSCKGHGSAPHKWHNPVNIPWRCREAVTWQTTLSPQRSSSQRISSPRISSPRISSQQISSQRISSSGSHPSGSHPSGSHPSGSHPR
jgi:hypothetical protein